MDFLLGRKAEDAAALMRERGIEPVIEQTGPDDGTGIVRVVQVLDGGALLRTARFPAEPEL